MATLIHDPALEKDILARRRATGERILLRRGLGRSICRVADAQRQSPTHGDPNCGGL